MPKSRISAPPVSASDQSDGRASRPGRIGKVVIVGRDAALWLAVNVLWTAFHRTGLEIVAVELPSRLRASDLFPTLQNQQAFHGLMGIKEGPLMAATQATYSLAQRFAGFSGPRTAFIHGYGAYGAPINTVPFHHYWMKARANGLKAGYDDFSLNAVAARQGRFFMPDADTDSFAACDYVYHLPAAAYCQVLRQVALQRGIKPVRADLGAVSHDPQNGYITAIGLSNGQTVTGDFFIDATGAQSLLLGAALETDFLSWRQWFPCDRLLTTTGPAIRALPALSEVQAFRSGWVGLFPLRDRTAVQQAYASADLDEEEALNSAAEVTAMRFGAESVVTPYAPGRRRSIWSANCVGIGEAAAVFDPIDSVGIQIILAGLAHLTSLFPVDAHMGPESAEYNRNVTATFEHIRDYQIGHYKLNQRHGEPLWDDCRAAAAPDSLGYKIDLFEARGHLVEYDEETFVDHDWHSLFIGHGLMPRAYDPMVDQTPDKEVIQRLRQILGTIARRVEAMKPMEAYFTRPAPVT